MLHDFSLHQIASDLHAVDFLAQRVISDMEIYASLLQLELRFAVEVSSDNTQLCLRLQIKKRFRFFFVADFSLSLSRR
jgi:hypothetical protein